MSKNIALASLVLAGVFAFAPIASAATLTAAQISAVEALLSSFGASPSVIANVDASLKGGASTSSVAPVSTSPSTAVTPALPSVPATGTSTPIGSLIPKCLEFQGNLLPGSSGPLVLQLQQALGVSATGYFGSLTQAAVQSFQEQQGIVSSGTPSTTGYGAIGPATRAAFLTWCHSQPIPPLTPPTDATTTSPTTMNPVAPTLSASPSAGPAPLAVTFSGTVGNSCNGGNYVLNFGDQSSATVAIPADKCNGAFTLSHTYAMGGNYRATLAVGSGIFATTVAVASPSLTAVPTLAASPSAGPAPLTVAFTTGSLASGSYAISFGDGSTGTLTPQGCTTSVPGSCTYGASHTYTVPGIYTAILGAACNAPAGAACAPQRLASATVSVASVAPTPVSKPTASLRASPSSGPAPLTVTFSGDTGSGCNGGASTLAFGDGSSTQVNIPADKCDSSFTLSHTYTTPGSYRPSLTNGASIVATSVNVASVSQQKLGGMVSFTVPGSVTLASGQTGADTKTNFTITLKTIEISQTSSIGSAAHATAVIATLAGGNCTGASCTNVVIKPQDVTLSSGASTTFFGRTITLSSLTASNATFSVK